MIEDVRTSDVTREAGETPTKSVHVACEVPASHCRLYESMLAPPMSAAAASAVQVTSIYVSDVEAPRAGAAIAVGSV